MDYEKLTSVQRCRLKKKGHVFPRKERHPPRIKGFISKHEMVCAGCGSDFVGMKDPSSMRNFCSHKCYRSFLSGKNNPNFKGGDIQTQCKICQKHFTQKRNGSELKKTCSTKCRSILIHSYKRTSPIQDRINRNVRRSIHTYITRGNKGGRKWRDILGFGPVDLMAHLEALFHPGMTWENYGLWHIDHKRPVCSFGFKTVEDQDFLKCWSLKNLQPLWALENMKKGGRFYEDVDRA